MESQDAPGVSVVVSVVIDSVGIEYRIVALVIEAIVSASLRLVPSGEIVASVILILIPGIGVVDRILCIRIHSIVDFPCGSRAVGLHILHDPVHVRSEIHVIVLCREIDERQDGQ